MGARRERCAPARGLLQLESDLAGICQTPPAVAIEAAAQQTNHRFWRMRGKGIPDRVTRDNGGEDVCDRLPVEDTAAR